MTSARLTALMGVLLIASPLAAAEGVRLPQPAPKSRNQDRSLAIANAN
jgi:hypothetical protein